MSTLVLRPFIPEPQKDRLIAILIGFGVTYEEVSNGAIKVEMPNLHRATICRRAEDLGYDA